MHITPTMAGRQAAIASTECPHHVHRNICHIYHHPALRMHLSFFSPKDPNHYDDLHLPHMCHRVTCTQKVPTSLVAAFQASTEMQQGMQFRARQSSTSIRRVTSAPLYCLLVVLACLAGVQYCTAADTSRAPGKSLRQLAMHLAWPTSAKPAARTHKQPASLAGTDTTCWV